MLLSEGVAAVPGIYFVYERPDGVDWIPEKMENCQEPPFIKRRKLDIADEEEDGNKPCGEPRPNVQVKSLFRAAQFPASRQCEGDVAEISYRPAAIISSEDVVVLGQGMIAE